MENKFLYYKSMIDGVREFDNTDSEFICLKLLNGIEQ